MKVRELIDYLYKCNPEYEIVFQCYDSDNIIIEETTCVTDENDNRVVITT